MNNSIRQKQISNRFNKHFNWCCKIKKKLFHFLVFRVNESPFWLLGSMPNFERYHWLTNGCNPVSIILFISILFQISAFDVHQIRLCILHYKFNRIVQLNKTVMLVNITKPKSILLHFFVYCWFSLLLSGWNGMELHSMQTICFHSDRLIFILHSIRIEYNTELKLTMNR